MRTKTRDGKSLKPGMVIRTRGWDDSGTDLTVFREVAAVTKVFGWPHDRYITFTDGTCSRVGVHRDWQIARGKTTRNGAKARAATIPSLALANALSLLGAYATA